MSAIGERLKEEVEKIGGITAAARAAKCATNTVYNWIDKGNIPADKLEMLGEAGVDMAYVVTGARFRPDIAPAAEGGATLIVPPLLRGDDDKDGVERVKNHIKAIVDQMEDEKRLRIVESELEIAQQKAALERRLEELIRRAS